jgi:hypothetical protein
VAAETSSPIRVESRKPTSREYYDLTLDTWASHRQPGSIAGSLGFVAMTSGPQSLTAGTDLKNEPNGKGD